MDPHTRAVAFGTLSGFTGVLVAVLVAFGRSLQSMPQEIWLLIPVGLLTALLLAMVRVGWMRRAMLVAAAAAPLRYVVRSSDQIHGGSERLVSWIPVTSARLAELVGDIVGGLVLGFAVFGIAVFFKEMEDRGWKFGKFLLVGPMLGLLWVCLVPLEQIAILNTVVSRQDIFYGFFYGVIVGDGVGLGAEIHGLLRPLESVEGTVP